MRLIDFATKTIFLGIYMTMAGLYFHKINNSELIYGDEMNLPLKSLESLKEGQARSKVTYYDVKYHGINTPHEFENVQITRRKKSAYNYELLYASPLYFEIFRRLPNFLENSQYYLLSLMLASFWMMSMILTPKWKYRILVNCLFLANPFILSSVVVKDVAIVEFFFIILALYLIINWVIFF